MSQSASSESAEVNGENCVMINHDADSPTASSPQQPSPPPQPTSPSIKTDDRVLDAAANDVVADVAAADFALSTTPSKTPPRPTLLTGLAQPPESPSSESGKKLSPFPEEWGEESAELLDGMRKKSVAIQDAKEAAIQRLQEELQKSKETLKLRDVEVEKLSKIRDEMGAELEELTASLFEEAHKMVHDANVKRAAAEKQVAEANMQIEVLSAEVQALKALVLTSTPSTPNRHLHPQISPSPERKSSTGSPNKSMVNGGHKRAASHGGVSNSILNSSIHSGGRSSFGAGGASTPPKFAAPVTAAGDPNDPANIPLPHPCPKSPQQSGELTFSVASVKREQIDPVAFEEFSSWIENPILDSSTPFLARIYAEDIHPCFTFENQELASAMLTAIETNAIVIEPLLPGNTSLPRSSAAYGGRKCALSLLSKACNYKVRLEDDSDADSSSVSSSSSSADATTWHYISDFCRNRVIAVCDFYTYARYIVQGLVKKKSDDALETFCQILRLRRNMTLARLGFEAPRDL